MAKPAVFFFLVISLFFFLSSSSARLLNDFIPQSLAATEPALNLVLPSEKIIHANPPEKDSNQNVLPCDMESNKNFDVKIGTRLAGKYYGRSTIFNMLPKGTVPFSGPSKGTNEIKN
ncbi:hypothetical protein JCGZ_03337 [Jatropha curcas]|uniref:Uncharacterized protein n=1 Tax=Jatropha curcas TaxID=180498 RepID=A0A067JCV9_JATCU|nr:hypothetical protein JCGZ_03337 [Jatropha curcas]